MLGPKTVAPKIQYYECINRFVRTFSKHDVDVLQVYGSSAKEDRTENERAIE